MLSTVAAKRGWWRRSRMKSSSWRRSWTWPSATIWCVANASSSAEAVASAAAGAAMAGVADATAAMVAPATASTASTRRRVGSCMGRGLSLWGGDSGEVARKGPAADGERHEREVDEEQPDRREHGDVVGQACRGTDELEGQVVADAASGSAPRRQGLRDAPDDDDAHRETRVAGDGADQCTGRAEDGAAECRAGEDEGDVREAEAGVDVIAGRDRQDDGHRGAGKDRCEHGADGGVGDGVRRGDPPSAGVDEVGHPDRVDPTAARRED